jgi:uncharacterized protein YukE
VAHDYDRAVPSFSVAVAELMGLAQVLNAQGHATSEAAALPGQESGNGEVDAALSRLTSRWSAQTEALSELVTSLAVAIGAAAVDYAETDQQAAAGFRK